MQRREIVSAVFFGFEGGIAELHLRDFILKDEKTMALSLVSLEYGKGHPLDYFALGVNQLVYETTAKNRDFWRQNGLTGGARRLVEMEIRAHPEIIGPPVDVLRVTKDGAKWIQRKKECPDVQSPSPKKTRHKRKRR